MPSRASNPPIQSAGKGLPIPSSSLRRMRDQNPPPASAETKTCFQPAPFFPNRGKPWPRFSPTVADHGLAFRATEAPHGHGLTQIRRGSAAHPRAAAVVPSRRCPESGCPKLLILWSGSASHSTFRISPGSLTRFAHNYPSPAHNESGAVSATRAQPVQTHQIRTMRKKITATARRQLHAFTRREQKVAPRL
jgi:hypothetical protein